MTRGRYPADRNRDLMNVAAAVVGSAAAAQVVHRGEAVRGSADRLTSTERAVIDAAREYARTGGEAHHELMDAVAALERAERGE